MDHHDGQLTDPVAGGGVRSQGDDAIANLFERAEAAEACGDGEAAYAWRQLAAAAAKLIGLLQSA